jgi:hypothetical protein
VPSSDNLSLTFRTACSILLQNNFCLITSRSAFITLANVLAVSQPARTVVLIGAPQQLDQPTQGSHPEGTDVSVLAHLLGGEQVIPPDRGLFLAETWRLHPSICNFTSEAFYAGKLKPKAGLERQVIKGSVSGSVSGIYRLPIPAIRTARPGRRQLSAISSSRCWRVAQHGQMLRARRSHSRYTTSW